MSQSLSSLFKKDKMKIIGLISGTSADGIDAALCEVSGSTLDDFSLELIKFLKPIPCNDTGEEYPVGQCPIIIK